MRHRLKPDEKDRCGQLTAPTLKAGAGMPDGKQKEKSRSIHGALSAHVRKQNLQVPIEFPQSSHVYQGPRNWTVISLLAV